MVHHMPLSRQFTGQGFDTRPLVALIVCRVHENEAFKSFRSITSNEINSWLKRGLVKRILADCKHVGPVSELS